MLATVNVTVLRLIYEIFSDFSWQTEQRALPLAAGSVSMSLATELKLKVSNICAVRSCKSCEVNEGYK